MRTSEILENNAEASLYDTARESLSRVRLFVTPRTVAHQAPLYMRFSREEYWSGVPFPPLGDLLAYPGIEPESPAMQAGSLLLSHQGRKPSSPRLHSVPQEES